MEKRKSLIAGNWKMHKTCEESAEAASAIVAFVPDIIDRDIMIAPTFTSLATVSHIVKGTNISLGAQNLHWETKGAFTGEISGPMLVSAGCDYVIIGHSERRQYFQETDHTVNMKLKAAVKFDLIPVMCIGETEKEYDGKNTISVLDNQLKKGLEGLTPASLAKLVIAYEPVWAIGTGKTAKSTLVQDVHAFIRSSINKLFGNVLAKSMRIIYGGSVKPENITELMSQPDIDGVLVGGASLEPDTFSKIIRY